MPSKNDIIEEFEQQRKKWLQENKGKKKIYAFQQQSQKVSPEEDISTTKGYKALMICLTAFLVLCVFMVTFFGIQYFYPIVRELLETGAIG